MKITPFQPTAVTAETEKTQQDSPSRAHSNSESAVVDVRYDGTEVGIPPDISRRLDEVAELIRSGEYFVDFGKLADRLVDDQIARLDIEK